MVGDASFTKKTVNHAFVKDISAWTFQETGVLKVQCVEHWGVEKGPGVVNGGVYRIKSDVVSIALYYVCFMSAEMNSPL